MPLTNELGEAIRQELGVEWPQGYDGSSFEEQLTVLSTALPFLEGYENTGRRALAERITAQLARELESRAESVARNAAPDWLLQLVALWHAEKAIILTFNYDTIVEHAVTSLSPVVAAGQATQSIHGSRVVYPAPRAAATYTYRDMDGPIGGSLRLLKLHGSLNWFWSLGDGNTVVREPYIEGFGDQPDRRAAELGGTRMLDRFLIPPVLSKDSYYNVNLVHMLWREAYAAISSANHLTVIGYSMPQGDRIAADLIRNLPANTTADLVNYDVGSTADGSSPLGRATAIGLHVGLTWEGEHAVSDYVSDRLDAAARALAEDPIVREQVKAVVVASAHVNGDNPRPRSFAIRSDGSGFEGVEFARDTAAQGRSPVDLALTALPAGTVTRDEFLDGSRLREVLKDDANIRVRLGGREFIAIGARGMRLGGQNVIELSVAPA